MVIDDQIRKCVVFVAVKSIEKDEYRFVGSAFYTDAPIPGSERSGIYLVTARHVIDGIRALGADTVYLRINLKDAKSTWQSLPIANWVFHPTEHNVDVAVVPFPLDESWDHLILPARVFLNKGMIASSALGVGDEVFITGLFKHHKGELRNIPICRVGNLAALDEEKIATSKYGSIDGYLIEARSIGGISGSPVFVHFGSTRAIRGVVVMGGGSPYALLGLIHGHFDSDAGAIDITADADTAKLNVNTGIAIVIPYYKIREVLDQPALVAQRLQLLAGSPPQV